MTNTFRYTYSAEVIIAKNKDLVWEALVDLQNYHLWNPFTPEVDTKWKIGDPVTLTVAMNKDKAPIIQNEFITKYQAKDEFAWGMNWGSLLRAERLQKLSSIAEGKTLYFTEDIIRGLLSPLVHLLYGQSIQSGFNRLASGLKKYLESQ